MTEPGAGAPMLLHAHLFKNAGSSLDWALARCFGDAFLDHRDDAAMRGNAAYLADLVEGRRDLRALSSHWLPLPPPTSQREVVPVALLRDPVLRLRSVYEFERRQAVDHPGTRRAREGSFRDYVAWRLDAATGPVLRDYQTRMLSGCYPGPGDDAQAAAALAVADGFPVLGIVERFDETMVLLEDRLRGFFPDIDLAYLRQNASSDAPQAEHAAARSAIEAELGDLFGAVRAANARDISLYRRAIERFDAQWAALPDAVTRLAQFRERCRALATDAT